MTNTTNNTTIDINAITAALEDLDWDVRVEGDTIEIETHSGLGEDLVETLDKSNPAGSMEDIAF